MDRDALECLVESATDRHKLSIARLISIFEDQRDEARASRATVLDLLRDHPRRRYGHLVAITGSPGAGKSSLLGRIGQALVDRDPHACWAVLAVDPSSHVSGGALLGDRTRVRFAVSSPRLFFRSQASDSELGGIGPWTFQVCRLLHHLFDCVFIETVGVGQSELAVRYLADRMYLVLQPMAGDELQFLKAGIMEAPDAIILNKCDEEQAARRTQAALESSLALARPFDREAVPVHRTSATTGLGIASLADELLQFLRDSERPELASREARHFSRWVQGEWGRQGSRLLEERGSGARSYIAESGSYDRAQSCFGRDLLLWLAAADGEKGP